MVKLGAYVWLKSPLIPFRLKRIASLYGVTPYRKTCDLMEADLNLVTTLKELADFKILPPNYHYIGPVYFRKTGEIPDEVLKAKADSMASGCPLLYFAMGSSASKALVLSVLNSLRELDMIVVAPVMSYLSPLELAKFNDTSLIITDWLPADSVNQLADLALIHGGEGTIQTACAAGKPFAGLGLQSEQRANIKQCAAYGNAIELIREQLNVEELKRVFDKLLGATFIEKAKSMARLMNQVDGAKNAARIIRKILD